MSRAIALAELLPDVVGIPGDLVIGGLVQDSRDLQPGDAFVAIEGFGSHGLKFAGQALAAGASAILFEPPAPIDLPPPDGAIAVPRLRARLGELGDRLHGRASESMTVVGVTGTNGKTSTVQLLAQAWQLRGVCSGTIGTLGAGLYGKAVTTGFTTPLVLRLHALLAELQAAGAQALAMEVSSHALDQGRVDGVHFDVALFTNLTRDHLDYHGDMAGYGAAKKRLFQWPGLKAAAINLDDEFGRSLHDWLTGATATATTGANPPLTPTFSPDGGAVGGEGAVAPLRVIGLSSRGQAAANVHAECLQLDDTGIGFDLVVGGDRHRVHSPLLGRFNVDNLLAVAGALHALGDGTAQIAQTLSQLQPIHGRMNRLGGDGQPLVVIDYAHTPDALEQALASLRAHASARLVCVFGCGGDRDRGKRPQMAAVAQTHADRIIVTDDNPRCEDGDAIVAEILAGFQHPQQVLVQRDRRAAIARAIGEAGPGDIVLIAGKGHEPYQEIAGVKHPFDDTAVARSCLEARPPHKDVQGSRAQDAQERP